MAKFYTLSSSPSRYRASPSRISGVTDCDGTWPWKPRLPGGLYKVRPYLVLHDRNSGSGGKCSCFRKPVEHKLQTEEMVAVGVSDVNGREILAAAGDPIRQLL